MTKYTVMVKGNPVTFESPYTNTQAFNLLRRVRSPFAQDLVATCESRGLSANQWAWVHKLVVDANAPVVAVNPVPAVTASLTKVVALFDHAATSLKRPRITLDVDGRVVVLSRASDTSRNPGCVYVTTPVPGSDEPLYHGCVQRDGTFRASRSCSTEIPGVFGKLADDPAGYAAAHGHKTGKCCFCNRRLEDERSTEVGYGPVCADKFGMPWGSLSGEAKTARDNRLAPPTPAPVPSVTVGTMTASPVTVAAPETVPTTTARLDWANRETCVTDGPEFYRQDEWAYYSYWVVPFTAPVFPVPAAETCWAIVRELERTVAGGTPVTFGYLCPTLTEDHKPALLVRQRFPINP